MNHNANILIVDDETVVRLSYLRSLATASYDAVAVGSGAEALHMLDHYPFELVFLDLRMPDMDGIAVLKTIKQKWPTCEVVIITGYPTLDTAKEAVRLGAYHYLVKPVSPDELIKAAQQALVQKHWALRKDVTRRNEAEPQRCRWTGDLPLFAR